MSVSEKVDKEKKMIYWDVMIGAMVDYLKENKEKMCLEDMLKTIYSGTVLEVINTMSEKEYAEIATDEYKDFINDISNESFNAISDFLNDGEGNINVRSLLLAMVHHNAALCEFIINVIKNDN